MKNFIRLISVVLMLSMLLCGCSEPAEKTDHDVCLGILNSFIDAHKSSDTETASSFFSPELVSGYISFTRMPEDEAKTCLLGNCTDHFPGQVTDFTLVAEAEADDVASNKNVTFFDKELEQQVIDSWPDGIMGYYCDKYGVLSILFGSLETSYGYTPEKLFVITADVNFDDGSSQPLDFIFESCDGKWYLWSVWESK